MKVYILFESVGVYEDHYIKIIHVFSDPVKAEERLRSVESDYKSRLDNIGEEPDINNEDSGWDLWFAEKLECEDFNKCFIEEHEIE